MSGRTAMDAGAEAGTLFKAGKLSEAVAAATAALRKAPSSVDVRFLLAEFLLFQENFTRIDTLLDAVVTIDPAAAVAAVAFRQLLRAEVARRQLLSDGRLPAFIGGPTMAQQAALAAVVALRTGDLAAAAAACAQAEAARSRPAGLQDGVDFNDIRDADDVLGGSLEVLTTKGEYFWIPFDRIAAFQPHKPRRPRDLFWRRVTVAVADGLEGDVYLPVLYQPFDTLSDECRLGRATDWIELAPGLVRGVGQKITLVGEEGVPLLQMGAMTFKQ